MAVGLAMDAFAVSIAAGAFLGNVTPRHVFRMAFHLGLFQFLMPILGWLAGVRLTAYVGGYDHWLAFGLLSYVGGKMLVDALSGNDKKAETDPTRGLLLVTLAVATSIDALAVGLGMAFLKVPVLLPSVVIGLTAAFFSAVGIAFAGKILRRWSRGAEIFGGIVLLLIGVRIVFVHLTAS
jgi:putative Mn2+ efflux pump MntP